MDKTKFDNVEIEIKENGEIEIIDYDILFPATKNYPKEENNE